MIAGKYSNSSTWEYPTISSRTSSSISLSGLTSFSDFAFAKKNIGTNINEKDDSGILLYTNANNQIVISIANYENNSEAMILNAVGQLIVRKPLNAPTTTINTKLAAGIYLISINTPKQNICKKIIVK